MITGQNLTPLLAKSGVDDNRWSTASDVTSCEVYHMTGTGTFGLLVHKLPPGLASRAEVGYAASSNSSPVKTADETNQLGLELTQFEECSWHYSSSARVPILQHGCFHVVWVGLSQQKNFSQGRLV